MYGYTPDEGVGMPVVRRRPTGKPRFGRPDHRIVGHRPGITERKRMEAARDQFIANAAHELRTPLAALAGQGETRPITCTT